jgi:hypothetical protein
MTKIKLKIWLSATDLSDQDLVKIKSVLPKYEIVFGQQQIQNSFTDFSLENHLAELGKCHLFLGIINPKTATFNLAIDNIFLKEIEKAIELGMPYWYVVHHNVTFTRNLLNNLVLKNDAPQSWNINVFDIRTIDIYDAILTQSRVSSNLMQVTDFFRLSTFIDSINDGLLNTNTRKRVLKLMLASTVYGFEDQLSKIIADLENQNFQILNSFYGSIKVNPNLSNLDNCIQAVSETEWFVGIVRPYYGTGNIRDKDVQNSEDKNITFEEIKKAIELDLPRWFYVHSDVQFRSKILKYVTIKTTFEEKKSGKIINKNELQKNPYLDPQTILLYNYVIKDYESNVALRNGNWAQEFFSMSEAIRYIHTQFSDTGFITELLNNTQNGR